MMGLAAGQRRTRMRLKRFMGQRAGIAVAIAVSGLLCLPFTSETAATDPPAGAEFPSVNGNLANQRHSTLSRITPSNIQRLGGAWHVHLEDGKPNQMQSAPVVAGGVMYVTTGLQAVVALDAKTGAIK